MNATFPNPGPLLNEREAARLLGLSVSTLQARRFHGKPPEYLKFGKAVRYERETLLRFIDSCRVSPEAA